MTGRIGLNILGMGQSAESVAARVRDLDGRTHLVMDEPKLAALLLNQGVQRVIYRRSDDDHAHHHHDPASFARQLHEAAPPGAWLYGGNEPGRADLPLLATWTKAFLLECNILKRKAVVFNFEVGAPLPADWNALREVCAVAKAGGHAVGLHYYFDMEVARNGDFFNQHLEARAVLGGDGPEFIVTELGCAVGFDAHRGWRDAPNYGANAYADQIEILATILHAAGMDSLLFADGDLGRFKTFDTRDDTLMRRLIDLNKRLRIGAVAPPVPPTPPEVPPPPQKRCVEAARALRATAVRLRNEAAALEREANALEDL